MQSTYEEQGYQVVALNLSIHVGLGKAEITHETQSYPERLADDSQFCLRGRWVVGPWRCTEVIRLVHGDYSQASISDLL